MKAIRAEMIMETANFKRPTSFLLHETFPLPPFSTVIGMIHAACGFREYHDMKICVQGTDDGIYTDYCTMYTFAPKKMESGRVYGGGVYMDEEGKPTGVYKTPMYIEVISNPSIVLYIVPDENDFKTVFNGLKHPANYLALGRYDDIVNIVSVEEVELEEIAEDPDGETLLFSEKNMYIPKESTYGMSKSKGTVYTLHKEYTIQDKRRVWKDSYEVTVLAKGSFVSDRNGNCDFMAYKGNLVCLF